MSPVTFNVPLTSEVRKGRIHLTPDISKINTSRLVCLQAHKGNLRLYEKGVSAMFFMPKLTKYYQRKASLKARKCFPRRRKSIWKCNYNCSETWPLAWDQKNDNKARIARSNQCGIPRKIDKEELPSVV